MYSLVYAKMKSQAKSLHSRKSFLLIVGIIFLFFSSVMGMFFLYGTRQQSYPDIKMVAKNFIQNCEKSADWQKCYGKQFALLVKRTTLPYSLDVLNAVSNGDHKTRDCHIMAHKIMLEAVAEDPKHWMDYLRAIDPTACTYGYVHGILEARSRVDSSFTINEKTIPEFCLTYAHKNGGKGIDQTCSHIMGHLLLVESRWNIPQAVATCGKIQEDLQRECYGGVFMENFTRDNLVAHGLASYSPWTPTLIGKQEELCFQQTGNAGLGCWQQMSQLYLQNHMRDPDGVYALCSQSGNEAYTNQCYVNALGGFLELQDDEKVFYQSLCGRFAGDYKEYDKCTQYGVRTLLHASVKNADRSISFCNATISTFKSRCFSLIGLVLKERVSEKEQVSDCRKIEKEYQEDCVRGVI